MREAVLLYIQTQFLFLIGRHSPVNSQCPETNPQKLQKSENDLQLFGKLIAPVFLLQIFSCIYRCFECIVKQLLDSAYPYYQELSRPRSILFTSAFGFGRSHQPRSR